VRWDGISASVDCRTPSERGEAAARGEGAGDAAARAEEALAGGGTRRLAKSRYSSISTYIGGPETSLVDAVHNDIACEADPFKFTGKQNAHALRAAARSATKDVLFSPTPILNSLRIP
jgi:hypothetical protein